MREKSISKKTKPSDIALKVEHVSKIFRLPTEQASGIKQAFINRMRGIKGYTEQQVLKDISFEVKKGDFFGVVGRNGSGKSTLLKLISQIYTPDSGRITVKGSLVPFIELGVGFNPELTGRENVYLNGAMLGFSKEEIDEMYDEIVEFAELHDFMDQKLKNYSSGMQVRLAFSVAIKAQGDILVLDEVLAVGDEAFQRKCEKFFGQIKKDRTKTVILVTHSMDSVRKYCTKALMIRNGEIAVAGSPEDVANEYSLENNQMASSKEKNDTDRSKTLSKVSDINIELLSPKIINEHIPVEMRVSYSTTEDETGIYICLVDVDRGVPLYDTPLLNIKGSKIEQELRVTITEINNANIKVSASIRDKHNNIIGFLSEDQLPSFLFRRNDHEINKPISTYGIINNVGKWS